MADNTFNTSAHPPVIGGLVERVRRRRRLHGIIEAGLWGALAGLAAFAVLLIFGTGLFSWIYVVLAGVAGTAWGWRKRRSRVADPYIAALRVDRALEAQDLIATAWYFERNPRPSRVTGDVIQNAAARLEGSEPSTLVPWKMPRAGWVAAGLALACIGLGGIRYGILNSLELRSNIARVRFDTVTGAPVKEDSRKRPGPPKGYEGIGVDIPGYEQASLSGDEKREQYERIEGQENQSGAQGTRGRESASGAEGSEGEAGEEGGDAPGPEPLSAGTPEPGRPDANRGKNPPPAKPNSLLEKMRDALANLMDKMKSDPQGGEGKQQASNNAQKQPGQGQKRPGQQPSPGQQTEMDGEAQDSDQASDGSQSDRAKSRSGDQGEQESKNEKSGMGSQDGRKETELAQHAEAMGKLTELFGKRAQNVEGEVMVEVTRSRNQGARTPYQERQAAHGDSGGEVSRDEVPLHLQDYVQKYYEKVRRQPQQQPQQGETKQ